MLFETICFDAQLEKFFTCSGGVQKKNSYQGGWRLSQRSSSKKAPGDGTSSEHSYRYIWKREKFLNLEIRWKNGEMRKRRAAGSDFGWRGAFPERASRARGCETFISQLSFRVMSVIRYIDRVFFASKNIIECVDDFREWQS